jgi:hypothetical protein
LNRLLIAWLVPDNTRAFVGGVTLRLPLSPIRDEFSGCNRASQASDAPDFPAFESEAVWSRRCFSSRRKAHFGCL